MEVLAFTHPEDTIDIAGHPLTHGEVDLLRESHMMLARHGD